MGPWARAHGSFKARAVAEDGVGRLALALERALAELVVGSVGRRVGDGGEGGERGKLELGSEKLAACGEELMELGEEFGVFTRPVHEGGEGHVHALGDIGEGALFKKGGEDCVVVGGVCVCHA